LWREAVRLDPVEAGLRLSDLVVACGPPIQSAAGGPRSVRIEPNPGARVAGDAPMTAYFEIDGLAAGPDGRARFETAYTVKSADRDPRIWIQRALSPRSRMAPVQVMREEEQRGALRRQFVTVPVQGIPPGRYRLEVRVRDLVANAEATTRVEFQREPSPFGFGP
jgi:hypothetical protein